MLLLAIIVHLLMYVVYLTYVTVSYTSALHRTGTSYWYTWVQVSEVDKAVALQLPERQIYILHLLVTYLTIVPVI